MDESGKLEKRVQEFYLSDSRDDKKRIENTKGGLVTRVVPLDHRKPRLPALAQRPANQAVLDQGQSRQGQDDAALLNYRRARGA
jgi:hypothetical protein